MAKSNASLVTQSRAFNAADLIALAISASDPLRRAQLLANAQAQLAWTLRSAVEECAESDISWAKIGEAVGMPRESIFRQYSAGAPIVALKAVQSPTSPNMADPRNRYPADAIFAFQTPDGRWWGPRDLLSEGQYRTAALPFHPAANVGSPFAGQMLMVRYGPIEQNVSFHAAQVVEPDGSPRRVRVTHDVMDLMFSDGQTPLRRAITAVVHAVLSNPRNPQQLREAVDRAAKAQNPAVPLADFVAAVKAVIETAETVEPTDIFSHEAIERLKKVVAEFDAWAGGAR